MGEESRRPDGGDEGDLPASLGGFEICGVLGEGGSGTVYDARWGHRRVALKVLRRELVPTDRERERFLAEAALLQAVDHPGVVKVLGSGALPDGRPYLAMEHLGGLSLADRVARGPTPLGEALVLFEQLAAAVEALHRRGLIHRDIKPENVILTGGHAVLLDFGIAKAENAPASTVTQEGSLRGTPAYMAPERFFGAPASASTDLYELAVLLYAVLAGRLPWDDVADPSARLNPPAPSRLGVALPGALETVLLQALSTRAEARPSSVAELVGRLREATPHAPPHGRPGEQLAPGERLTIDLPPARPGAAPPPDRAAAPPTAPGQPPPRRMSRTRALLVGGALLAAAAAAIAAVVLAGRSGAGAGAGAGEGSAASAAPDAGPPDPAPNRLAAPAALWQRAGERPAALDELLALHPADTIALAAVSPVRLRDSSLVAAALEDAKDSELLGQLAMVNALCRFDVPGSVELLVIGVAEGEPVPVDVTVRGTFERDAVERCAAEVLSEEGRPVRPRRRGKTTRIDSPEGVFWLAWPDRHTVLFTSRPVDEAWLKARMEGREPVTTAPWLAPLLAEVDTGAALWLVAEPPAASEPILPGTAPPRALYGSLLLTSELKIHTGLRYDSEEEAEKTARLLQKQLDGFTRDPLAALWLRGAGFGVVERDAVFTLSMGGATAGMTIEALLNLVK